MNKNPPILITGTGRSGTNWVLNLLDLYPGTHCRNEPHALEGSALGKIPYSDVRTQFAADFRDEFETAISVASRRFGERDRLPRQPKDYLPHWSVRFGLWGMLERQRCRKVLSIFSPSLARSEWTMPWWLGRSDTLEHARPVLKIISRHFWIAWALEQGLGYPVVHVIRHPAGFLNSWKNRFLASSDSDKVYRDNLHRLNLVCNSDTRWAEKIGDTTTMSVGELELWYWRYANEELYNSGNSSGDYLLVVYENLIANQEAEVQKILRHCNLDLGKSSDLPTQTNTVTSKQRNQEWYEKIDADPERASGWSDVTNAADLQIIERVMAGSFMADWFIPTKAHLPSVDSFR